MAATFHVHNPFYSPRRNVHNWLRSISPTAGRRNRAPPPVLQGGGGERDSVNYGGGWWILAPRASLVQDKGPPKFLGFRSGYKCFLLGFKRSNSSEKRGGVFGSGSGSGSASPPSAGSEIVADMGSESKDHNNGWYEENDFRSDIQSPLMHQHEPQRSKLLTLPTILTLARVAAVPIFVCSMLFDYAFTCFFFVYRNGVCFDRLIGIIWCAINVRSLILACFELRRTLLVWNWLRL